MLRVRSGAELTIRFTKDYYVQWGLVAARGATAARRPHGRDAMMIDDGVSADAVWNESSSSSQHGRTASGLI